MKILTILLICITPALAEDFKTLNGKEYKDATIARVEPDGVVLKYKSGISKVYFTELPKEVQERFHYDPAKAGQFNAAEQAAVARLNGGAPSKDYAAEAREKLKPWVDDNAVTPPQLRGAEFSPSYAETLEFINHKLQLGRRMWFGERSQKMILVLPRMNEAVIFDPATCDPRVKYVTRSGQYPDSYIEIESSNGKGEIQVINAFFGPEKSDKFFLHFGSDMDSLDLEKVAKAFRHLIEMFGGTPGNF